MNEKLLPYQNRLTRLRTRLQNPAFEERIPVIQNKINKIRTKAGVKTRDWTGWKPNYQTTPTPAPAPTEQPIQQEYWNSLQPQAIQTPAAAEPTNFQASPQYQWQQKQASQALNKELSARGLYDSGAALQANQDMTQQLMGNEVARQQAVEEWKQEVAAKNADRAQANSIGNANRLWDILGSEQARKDVLGQNQFNNKLSVLNWYANQNPMPYVASSINSSADMQAQLGKYAADYISQMYPQLFQYLPKLIPDFYPTGSTGGSQAEQAGASENA